jgi:hypothetical protein
MLEEHVAAEVGLEASLGVRLRHRESNLAGGTEEDLAQLGLGTTGQWAATPGLQLRRTRRPSHGNQNP